MEVNGDAVREIFKIIKVPYVLIAFILCTGLLLFLPDSIIKKMYLDSFRNNFGGIIGAIFLISLCLLLTILITHILKYINKKIENKKVLKGKIKYLLNLDVKKTNLIKNFIKEEDHTLSLDYNNGITQELTAFGLITQAGSTQAVSFGMDDGMYLRYFLQPWVINVINDNDELKKKFNNK